MGNLVGGGGTEEPKALFNHRQGAAGRLDAYKEVGFLPPSDRERQIDLRAPGVVWLNEEEKKAFQSPCPHPGEDVLAAPAADERDARLMDVSGRLLTRYSHAMALSEIMGRECCLSNIAYLRCMQSYPDPEDNHCAELGQALMRCSRRVHMEAVRVAGPELAVFTEKVDAGAAPTQLMEEYQALLTKWNTHRQYINLVTGSAKPEPVQ